MARSADNKAHALISYYVLKYKLRYKRDPIINRYKYKWGFEDMATDLGEELARQVIDSYFESTYPDHPITILLRDYELIAKRLKEIEEDRILRARLREETEQRVKEWRDNVQ